MLPVGRGAKQRQDVWGCQTSVRISKNQELQAERRSRNPTRLKPFEVGLHYTDRHRLPQGVERELGVTYLRGSLNQATKVRLGDWENGAERPRLLAGSRAVPSN